ncbi:MAG: glycosyltransferase family 1 protein [Dehalococcoidia bacterium]|nr:MAG: glycosyltransferase family 1 protein [Dehalococcoidia bacterium]
MKVAMVGPYPLDGVATGGIAAVALALSTALRQLDDIDLHIVTTGPRGASPSEPSMHLIVDSGRWRRLTMYRAERVAIARTLRDLAPDVVHAQGQNFFAIGALDAGLPSVVTLHGMLAREAAITDRRSKWTERLSKRVRGRFNARFEAATLRRARDIIVISPFVAHTIAGQTQARLHAIANPVDDAFFALTGAQRDGRLLYAGTLEPRKGLHDLIEAVRHLRARGVTVELRIAGADADPGYAASLRATATAMGAAVRFLGVINQQQLLDEYAAAALVVMSSVEETSPMLLQQAMAAGKASVAPAVGGIPDLIDDGVTGRVVTPRDPAALAGAIEALLGDKAARQRMGEAARAVAESRFRASAVAAATRDVYRTAIDLHR